MVSVVSRFDGQGPPYPLPPGRHHAAGKSPHPGNCSPEAGVSTVRRHLLSRPDGRSQRRTPRVGQQLVTNHKIGQQPLSTVKTTVIPAMNAIPTYVARLSTRLRDLKTVENLPRFLDMVLSHLALEGAL